MNILNQKTKIRKKKKSLTYENAYRLFKRRKKVLNGFESKIFLIGKQTRVNGIKILTPKQVIQKIANSTLKSKSR